MNDWTFGASVSAVWVAVLAVAHEAGVRSRNLRALALFLCWTTLMLLPLGCASHKADVVATPMTDGSVRVTATVSGKGRVEAQRDADGAISAVVDFQPPTITERALDAMSPGVIEGAMALPRRK